MGRTEDPRTPIKLAGLLIHNELDHACVNAIVNKFQMIASHVLAKLALLGRKKTALKTSAYVGGSAERQFS